MPRKMSDAEIDALVNGPPATPPPSGSTAVRYITAPPPADPRQSSGRGGTDFASATTKGLDEALVEERVTTAARLREQHPTLTNDEAYALADDEMAAARVAPSKAQTGATRAQVATMRTGTPSEQTQAEFAGGRLIPAAQLQEAGDIESRKRYRADAKKAGAEGVMGLAHAVLVGPPEAPAVEATTEGMRTGVIRNLREKGWEAAGAFMATPLVFAQETAGLFGVDLNLPTKDDQLAAYDEFGTALSDYANDTTVQKTVSPSGLAGVATRAGIKMGLTDIYAHMTGDTEHADDYTYLPDFDEPAKALYTADSAEKKAEAKARLAGLGYDQLPTSLRKDDTALVAEVRDGVRDGWIKNPKIIDDIDNGVTDAVLRSTIGRVPLADLGLLAPSPEEISRTYKRRAEAIQATGGEDADRLAELFAGGLYDVDSEADGRIMLKPSRMQHWMAVAGIAPEVFHEADIPVGPALAIFGAPVTLPLYAAAKATGHDDWIAMARELRVPTKAGLEFMAQTGAYDDVLTALGFKKGGEWAQLRDPDSTYTGRVAAEIMNPEWQGMGTQQTYRAAGGTVGSGIDKAFGTADVAADFLFDAEGEIIAPIEAAAKRVSRFSKAARLAPEGLRLAAGVSQLAPELRGLDGDAAFKQVMKRGVMAEIDSGRMVKEGAEVTETIDRMARDAGVSPEAMRMQLDVYAKARGVRTMDDIGAMVKRSGTPEVQVLRKSPEYLRVKGELEAMAAADNGLSASQVPAMLAIDEVGAQLAVDAGRVKSLEEYFKRVKYEAGGVPGEGAYFNTSPKKGGKLTADDVLSEFRSAQTITDGQLLTILGTRRPEYLDTVADFILSQREKVKAGEMTNRDVAKAYLATVASQRSDAIGLPRIEEGWRNVDTEVLDAAGQPIPVLDKNGRPKMEDGEPVYKTRQVKTPLGYAMKVDEQVSAAAGKRAAAGGGVRTVDFTSPGKTGRKLRPEEAMAAWMFTPEGQRALDAIERGEFDAEAWETAARIRDAYGANTLRVQDVFGPPGPGQYTMQNIGELTAEINAARGDPAKIEAALGRLRGVGSAKVPFIGHMLGFGEAPTIDAVEINGWLTGKGDIDAGASTQEALAEKLKKKYGASSAAAQKLTDELTAHVRGRFSALRDAGVAGTDLPDEVFGAIMHHWFWDKLKRAETTHEGLYEAMRYASETGGVRHGDIGPLYSKEDGVVKGSIQRLAVAKPSRTLPDGIAWDSVGSDGLEDGVWHLNFSANDRNVGFRRVNDAALSAIVGDDVAAKLRGGETYLEVPAPVREPAPAPRETRGIWDGMFEMLTDLDAAESDIDATYQRATQALPSELRTQVRGKIGETLIPPRSEGIAEDIAHVEAAIDYIRKTKDGAVAQAPGWAKSHLSKFYDEMESAAKAYEAAGVRDIKDIVTGEPYEANTPFHSRTGPTIHGSIEPAAAYAGHVIRLFQTGDFDTWLHEFSHRIRFEMGDAWTDHLTQFFDHEIVNGKRELTVKGEEQLAEATRIILRGKVHPNGKLRGYLDDVVSYLRDLWLRLRGKPLDIPDGYRAWWDATLDPSKSVKRPALLVDPDRMSPVSIPGAVGSKDVALLREENPVGRAGRKAEAARVQIEPRRARQALGVNASTVAVDPVELYADAMSEALLGQLRRGWGGEELTRMGTSIVPKSRAERITQTVREKIDGVLGKEKLTFDKEQKSLILTPEQQARVKVLIDEVAAEPMGEMLPTTLTAPNATLGTIAVKDWNALNTALIDIHAGPGAWRDLRAEKAAVSGLRALVGIVDDALFDNGTVLGGIKNDMARRFMVPELGGEYLRNGEVREGLERLRRELGDVSDEVRREVAAIKRKDPDADLTEFYRKMAGALPVLIDPDRAEAVVRMNSSLSPITPEKAGDLFSALDVADRDYGGLTAVFGASPRGVSPSEASALSELEWARANVRAGAVDPADLASDPAFLDALGMVQAGIKRRWQAIDQSAQTILGAFSGGDESVRAGYKDWPSAAVRLYTDWYTNPAQWPGIWTELARQGREMVERQGGSYNPNAAILAAIMRLRSQSLINDFFHDLVTRMPQLDPEMVARRGVAFSAPVTLGERAGGAGQHVEQVIQYLNAITGWKDRSLTLVAKGEAPTFHPALGIDVDGPGAMEAYGDAQRVLAGLGWKYGEGTGWNRYIVGDREVLLPDLLVREVDGVVDRTSKLGFAWSTDWATGGKPGTAAAALDKVIRPLWDTVAWTFGMARIGMTTGLILPNPAYFVGNAFGGMLQAYEAMGLQGVLDIGKSAVFLPGERAQMTRAVMARIWNDGKGINFYRPNAAPIISPTGAIWTADAIADAYARFGLNSSFPKAEAPRKLFDDIQRESGPFFQRWKNDKWMPLRYWQDTIMEVGTSVDNFYRTAIFIDSIKRGHSADQAAELARLAAFDYGALTDFERERARSVVMFYSYMRRNVDLTIWTMLNHPGRILGQLRGARGLQQFWLNNDSEAYVPEYMDGRFLLYYHDAVDESLTQNASRGMALFGPPAPYADSLGLMVDGLNAIDGDPDARRELGARLTPWFQAPIVAMTRQELFSGRDVQQYNQVPGWLVETSRLWDGGILADQFLQVEPIGQFDPAKESYPGADRYQARNGVGWWMFRNLTPAGRPMDTITQMARADFGESIFGEGGAPQAGVDALRWYREHGGVLDVVSVPIAQALLPGDAVALDEPLSTSPDLDTVRPGYTQGEERGKLFGFNPVQLDTAEMVADRAARDLSAASKQRTTTLRKADPFR